MAFIHLLEPCGALFMIDGCTFWASKSQSPFTAIIKLGKARTFFNRTSIVFIWKKKAIYTKDGLRVSKSWANFHFWVKYPFKLKFSQQHLWKKRFALILSLVFFLKKKKKKKVTVKLVLPQKNTTMNHFTLHTVMYKPKKDFTHEVTECICDNKCIWNSFKWTQSIETEWHTS